MSTAKRVRRPSRSTRPPRASVPVQLALGDASADGENGESAPPVAANSDEPEFVDDAPFGQLVDYISGQLVDATDEERDAVQVFSRRLVEDYGYSKAQIQTRPQFRVRKTPSDESKTFPVDIAVFNSKSRIESELFLIVECKKKDRKEGIDQLKLYMDMSPAYIGVWFNGNEHAYIRKVIHSNGTRTYIDNLPNIPRKGQRIEDVGHFLRKDLRRPSNLKAVFRDLRNHLAQNAEGTTRDEPLAKEIINLLFCKIFDELNTASNDPVAFRCGIDETPAKVKQRIVELFERKVKAEYSDVFEASDTITLDAASILYVVGELQSYCIVDADRDAVGDAFEVFIGPALRGAEGQFFTPRNVVRMVIEMLDPSPGDFIIDPACGSGGFLIASLEYVWKKLEEQGKRNNWTAVQLDRKKRDTASKFFRGIDKDSFLAKVTKAYMAIMGDGRGGIFCQNALHKPEEWGEACRGAVTLNAFNVVVTNPPFGSKIPVKGAATLAQYELGRRWKRNKETGFQAKTDAIHEEQAPHIIFLERCLQLLKPNGRLGIVLPESILGNPSYEHVIEFILQHTRIRAVVTMPEVLFKTSGKGGTHTKVCILILEKRQAPTMGYSIFMADAKWCGHDSRGNRTFRKNEKGEIVELDDVPEIAKRYRAMVNNSLKRVDRLGFAINLWDIRNRVLVPKYYDPELEQYLESLKPTHSLVSIGDLVENGALSLSTGTEIGKMAYGTGRIPFIRTSDLSNWEIKADFKHGVSRAIYRAYENTADVVDGDILMVRDGTYLIGTTAIVTKSDLPMLYQSHIYRIRVEDKAQIDPWLLFACLNSPVVKKQIRSKQFTQDIIDTLGKRILEVVIPVPKDKKLCRRVATEARTTVETRIKMRNRTSRIALEVEGLNPDTYKDDMEGEDEE